MQFTYIKPLLIYNNKEGGKQVQAILQFLLLGPLPISFQQLCQLGSIVCNSICILVELDVGPTFDSTVVSRSLLFASQTYPDALMLCGHAESNPVSRKNIYYITVSHSPSALLPGMVKGELCDFVGPGTVCES